MQFHLNLQVKAFEHQINLREKLLLMGTCFAENIGSKLLGYKFNVLENPHGILYNPVSICNALDSYLDEKIYVEGDLFQHNGIWASWGHHGRFSSPDKKSCLDAINNSQQKAIERIKNLDWLFITTGSAFVYNLKENNLVVGNCHKVPNKQFEKRLLSVDEITRAFEKTLDKILAQNPNLKVIFTISPVRYIRDGMVENNLSKAVLLQATHLLTKRYQQAFYFPAYELVIDDLRDYRFYKEDMVHPGSQAISYVWEKFEEACIESESLKILEQVKKILKAKEHRPIYPGSEEHHSFKKKYQEKAKQLLRDFPYIDLREELEYFSKA